MLRQSTPTRPPLANPVTDPRLSRKPDAVIIEIEQADPSRIRRTWLRWYKSHLERNVPAVYGRGGGQ